MKKRKLSIKTLKPIKMGFRSRVSIYKEKFSNQDRELIDKKITLLTKHFFLIFEVEIMISTHFCDI